MAKDTSQELTHYCEKHDQWYMDFLHRCPICWGEEMARDPQSLVIPYNTNEKVQRVESVPIKRIPQRIAAASPEPVPKRIPTRVPGRVPRRVS